MSQQEQERRAIDPFTLVLVLREVFDGDCLPMQAIVQYPYGFLFFVRIFIAKENGGRDRTRSKKSKSVRNTS